MEVKKTRQVKEVTSIYLTAEEIEGILKKHLGMEDFLSTTVNWDESHGGIRGAFVERSQIFYEDVD